MNVAAPPLIAHVIFKLDFGGLENGLVNIVNRMPPERYRHAIVCLAGFNPEYRRRISRKDVDVIPIGKRPGKDFPAYALVWKTLRRLRPDIIHTRNLGTIDLQWVAAAAGVPRRVHGEHGWEASDPRGQNRKNLRIRRACRPVIHRYVPMSQDIARWLERDVRVNPARIRQIYSGVDTERFRPSPPTLSRHSREREQSPHPSHPLPLTRARGQSPHPNPLPLTRARGWSPHPAFGHPLPAPPGEGRVRVRSPSALSAASIRSRTRSRCCGHSAVSSTHARRWRAACVSSSSVTDHSGHDCRISPQRLESPTG